MGYSGVGFFALKTGRDLREKARADLADLVAHPLDSCAAFNFFVTARHVPEWHFGTTQGGQVIESTPTLRICRHLGDGAKHFTLTAKKHTQVEDVVRHDGVFDAAVFDATAFDVPGLIVRLEPQEAKAAGLTETVGAVVLARHVMRELDGLF